MPIVQTTSGAVQGERLGGVHRFLGIPYAAPPVGDGRWRPPAPLRRWNGVRPATRFGPAAMQDARPDIELRSSISEDCLYLNIWTPDLSETARRPVMVWIHGGGFMFGAGSEPVHDGRALAEAGVVLVTFNYRLHVFGFLAHPQIGGNFGLLDQIAALRWIKANAARFGGDPDNLTIFGESAGAGAVANLMQAASADALFERAVLQSGGFSPPAGSRQVFGFEHAQETAEAVLENLECPDFETARSLDAARLLEAGNRLLLPKLMQRRFLLPEDVLFVPLVDERVAPFDEGLSSAAGRQVLLGFNDNEATYFARPELRFEEQEVTILLDVLAGEEAGAIRAELSEKGMGSPSSAIERLMTVGVFAEPAIDMAERLAEKGWSVFLYRFGRISPNARATGMLASHTYEIPYIFGSLPRDGYEPTDHRLADEMRAAWAAFAATGRPECGAGRWPGFDAAGLRVALLNDTVEDVPFEPPELFEAFRRLRTMNKAERREGAK